MKLAPDKIMVTQETPSQNKFGMVIKNREKKVGFLILLLAAHKLIAIALNQINHMHIMIYGKLEILCDWEDSFSLKSYPAVIQTVLSAVSFKI
jgi:hypothetical protein